MKEIAPQYNPKEVEEAIYKQWEEHNLFHVEPDQSRKPFTIVIPPPNVTGILHMGHALNNTLQDIIVRWKRMQNFNALWVPGTDHAGIATQNVVERSLAEKGTTRHRLGREKFVEEVWKWREKYGNTIINQLKRLGCSCDWDRTRFTMDEGLSEAVLEAFVSLYERGLIYRGNYIINWCPRCQTALSDEEAPHRDVEGKLYYILYPLAEAQSIIVATTRPETMLGDVAVAVHPKDIRYKKLIGKKVILPLVDREIEIIADDIVDRKFGTGAVKVTPAHDPYDFEMSKRHNLEPLKVMNPDGTMNENAGKFKGMDRFQCREAIVKELEEKKLLIKIEKHAHAVGHCYRCHTVIEPYLSLQWFVKMKPLAEPAIKAVKDGRIKFYPKRWTKVYLNWMENIKDWCISRQIWWGHRIPVYYCVKCQETESQKSKVKRQKLKVEKNIIVSKTKPEKCPVCGSADLVQDEDVLDTWFSSWLWPFSTLGWPQKTKDIEYFYPTDALITAPEILFFWVARMIMAGMEFMKEIPFKDVYIHGTVRDLTGKKMSKSLGNVIDPIDIINDFGSDALRFSIIAITATGQDVFLSKEKFELGRNFANKLWNASRFVLMNIQRDNREQSTPRQCSGQAENREKLSIADKWILSRLNGTIDTVTKALNSYKFNEAESLLYDFIWHDFCDWYIEMVKKEIIDDRIPLDNARLGAERIYIKRLGARRGRQSTEENIMHVLETSLKLLHPFMPFVTEAIWQHVHEHESVMIQKWPEPDSSLIDKDVLRSMEAAKSIIVSIRNLRSDMNIPHTAKLTAYLEPLKESSEKALTGMIDYIKNLAHLEELVMDKHIKKPRSSASVILEHFNMFIPLKGVIDVDAEKARLVKKEAQFKEQLVFIEKKLANKDFVKHAPEEVVAKEREKSEQLKEQIKRLQETIKDIT